MTPNSTEAVASLYKVFDFPRYQYHVKAEAFLTEISRDGMRVLDVGCGPGQLTSGLPGSVDVVGIDISPEMVDKARDTRPTGRYFVHDFHNSLPESEGLFDLVFAGGAFDLCNDIGKTLSALSGSLKENGLFYFTALEHRPGTSNNGERERRARPNLDVWLHFFTFQEVVAALGQAGLAPVSYQYAEGWKSRTLGSVFDYGYWVVTKPAVKPAYSRLGIE